MKLFGSVDRLDAMRRVLITFGTLAGGTAIAFALAGAAFLADPVGRLVTVNPGGWTDLPGRAWVGGAEIAIDTIDVPSKPIPVGVAPPIEVQEVMPLPAERGLVDDRMMQAIEAELERSGG